MSNNFFSPNAKVSGGALFCSFNSKEGDIQLRFIKQIANNANKKDNFDSQQYIVFKLTQDEAADIVRCVRTREKTSFFHTFNKDGVETKTTGNFSYYEIDVAANGDKPASKRKGFSMTVKRGDLEIKIGMTLGGAERFGLWMQNTLTHLFDVEHVADIEQAKEYAAKKKSESPTSAVAPKKTKTPEPEPAGGDDVDF